VNVVPPRNGGFVTDQAADAPGVPLPRSAHAGRQHSPAIAPKSSYFGDEGSRVVHGKAARSRIARPLVHDIGDLDPDATISSHRRGNDFPGGPREKAEPAAD
jgi:hypothetical protein